MASFWMDGMGSPGQVGFIVRHAKEGGSEWRSLDERPAHTNQSHEPRLEGWCGTTNNVAVYADGVGVIDEYRDNGRIKVRQLGGEALAAALEKLGYPELG